MPGPEARLEADIVAWAEDLGGEAYKLKKDNLRGWPDRTIFLPGGRLILPELKVPRKNKKYQQQTEQIARLRELGFQAGFCESLEDVQRLLLSPTKRGRV